MARNSAHPIRTWKTSTWQTCEWFQEADWQLQGLFVLLMGMPDVSPCGTLEITPRILCQRLNGLSKDQLMAMIGQLSPHVQWFPEYNTIWIKGFYEHQNLGRDGNYRTGAHRAAVNQPAPIKNAILTEYQELAEPYTKPIQGNVRESKPLEAPSDPLTKSGRVSKGIEGTLREGSESGSESETLLTEGREESPKPPSEFVYDPEKDFVLIYRGEFVKRNGHEPSWGEGQQAVLRKWADTVDPVRFRAGISRWLDAPIKHNLTFLLKDGIDSYLEGMQPKNQSRAAFGDSQPFISSTREVYPVLEPLSTDYGQPRRFNERLKSMEWLSMGTWSPFPPKPPAKVIEYAPPPKRRPLEKLEAVS